ncbi:MAG TPA: VOC family protein [Verrucomicrobiae bacterium]|nr:VOC family protein [Verrucomicrobiae bacterium]
MKAKIKKQKIVPFLWFDKNAEQAVNFYVSLFKNSRIVDVMFYGEAGPMPKGTVMTITFELEGQRFIALNGGPNFKFSPAISLFVNCTDQKEVDHLYKKLAAGGEELQCAWVTDKFGVTWQIVPTILLDLLSDKDATKVKNVTLAMFKMKKIDIKKLQAAYREK